MDNTSFVDMSSASRYVGDSALLCDRYKASPQVETNKRLRMMSYLAGLPKNYKVEVSSVLCDNLGYSDWRKLVDAFKRLANRTDLEFILLVSNPYRGIWQIEKT